MRTFRLICSGMLFCTLHLSAQENSCVRQIDYTVEKSITSGFITEVDLSDFSDFKLSGLLPFATSYHHHLCIESDGSFNSEKIFNSPAYRSSEWATEIYRITNKNGEISLFDQDDVEVLTVSPQDHGMETYASLSNSEINWMAFQRPIVLPSEEEIDWLENEGLEVFQHEENEVLVAGENMEWTLNDEDQTIFTNEFEDGQVIHSDLVKVVPISDTTALPLYTVAKTYESIEDEIILVTIEKKIFSQFRIDNELVLTNDLKLEEHDQEAMSDYITISDDMDLLSPNSNLIINPNPATSEVQLRLPFPGTPSHMDLEIFDLMGNSFFKDTFSNGGEELQLDISTWPKGVYLVNIRFQDSEIIKRLIIE